MDNKTFMAYGAISFTAVLLLYALAGSAAWIGTVSIPTAALVATVAIVGLMLLAAR